jgi:hypothetical protein
MTKDWDPEVAKEIKKLEFDRRIELITKLIVEKAKKEVENKNSKKKKTNSLESCEVYS